jgi:branched-chain amino acid transport system permease protein
MHAWAVQTFNSIAFAGLLFLLASGFTLIFGLMKIPNMAHGACFMLGGYVGYSVIRAGLPFFVAVAAAGVALALLGAIVERVVLRRMEANEFAQVLATVGIAFIIADASLWIWGGDALQIQEPAWLRGPVRMGDVVVPKYRIALIACAAVAAIGLWLLVDRTRLGAMIRAGVDNPAIARAMGIRVSALSTFVFCLGSALVGMGGVLGAPVISIYPGLEFDMLPLAFIVVILGGIGSLAGAFVGSIVIGFIYTFGQAWVADLAYVILFLPMALVLIVRPQGLFGRPAA